MFLGLYVRYVACFLRLACVLDVHHIRKLPPSYDQVIEENTQERITTSTASSQLSHNSSVATQTEEEKTHTSERSKSGELPPRTSLSHEITIRSTDQHQAANHDPPQLSSGQSSSVLVSSSVLRIFLSNQRLLRCSQDPALCPVLALSPNSESPTRSKVKRLLLCWETMLVTL
ncbi:hypothetical protein PDJAM_G00172050 [Pangasius djambal]|uniref:Uncharacterized protein n=1 Tax=Pangasius djambal TaxID=1691987 RepID=A0ACC5ZP64_9TELE|nr:hypothetical protein [Pangasius djambal]